MLERTHENATQPRRTNFKNSGPAARGRSDVSKPPQQLRDTASQTQNKARCNFPVLQDAKYSGWLVASTVSRALRVTDRGYCNRCGRAQLGTSSSGGRDSGWCELFVERKVAYSFIHKVVSSCCLRHGRDKRCQSSTVSEYELKSTTQILTQCGCSTFTVCRSHKKYVPPF